MFYAMPWINSTQSCDTQDDRHTGYERQWRSKGVGGGGGGNFAPKCISTTPIGAPIYI